MSTSITRSPGQTVSVGSLPFIVGGGHSGATEELDTLVQQAAEALQLEFGVPVQIRFNSDRESGGAWLYDGVEGFDAYGTIGIGASLCSIRPSEMSDDDWWDMPYAERRKLPVEIRIDTVVKERALFDPSLADRGNRGHRYSFVFHDSIPSAIAWLRQHTGGLR